MTAYKYCPLDVELQEIRLLKLLPGTFDDDIRCEMFHAPLREPANSEQLPKVTVQELQKTLPRGWEVYETIDGRFAFINRDAMVSTWTHPVPGFDPARYALTSWNLIPDYDPVYEALSYTWASAEPPGVVHVLTESGTTILQAQGNLLAALRHLRHVNRPRTLWIDALCINQEDRVERSKQVVRMDIIYRQAYRVVVWLGPATSDSGLALDMLERFGSQIEFARNGKGFRSPEVTDVKLQTMNEETWHAIMNLTSRSWFQRVWIWQEIQLANSRTVVQCGNDYMLWSIFRRTILMLLDLESLPSSETRDSLISLGPLCKDQQLRPFIHLLDITRYCLCSEPKDRIYGLLGFAQKWFTDGIHADYSLSDGQAYQKFFFEYVDCTGSLILLTHCNLSRRRVNAPTWVPDWSAEPVGLRHGALMIYPTVTVEATVEVEDHFVEPNILRVEAVHFATLTVAHEALPTDLVSSSREARAIFRQWEPQNLDTALYFTGESLLEAYITVLCLNRTKEHRPDLDIPSLRQCKDSYLRNVRSGDIETEVDFEADNFMGRVRQACSGRSFFKTHGGGIGLGPPAIQEGDFVCMIVGCSVPMILRKAGVSGYEVAGPCYFHGFMNGEAFLGPMPVTHKVVRPVNEDGEPFEAFQDISTGSLTYEDPRLGPLPAICERISYRTAYSDQKFRHKVTGGTTPYDPRVSAPVLRRIGIDLETFDLI